MKSAPLQVTSIFFTDVRISALPDHKESDFNKFDLDVKTEVFTPNPGTARSRAVILTIAIKPDEGAQVAYTGEISAFGNFMVADSWPDDIDKLAYINGSGILYAAVREMICSITARGPWPMVTIPSWSFGQMYLETEESKKKEAEAAKQPPLSLTTAQT